MKTTASSSYWRDAQKLPRYAYPDLDRNLEVDIVIIGAGVTGLTAAMHLKQAGIRIAVLEANRIGSGTTGDSSAHLDVLPDRGVSRLLDSMGEAKARHITQLRSDAIRQIEQWVQQLGINCEFNRVPAFLYCETAEGVGRIRREYEAAMNLGLEVSLTDQIELPFRTCSAMQIAQQARFNPLDYLFHLAQVLESEGVEIYEHTQAQPPQDGSPCTVTANGFEIKADGVIVATHSAFLGISLFDARQAAYQSYIVAARINDTVPDALFWDDNEPYHYTRLASSADERLLLVGGADHKTGQADEAQHIEQLKRYISDRYDVTRFEKQWSAQLFEPADGLPLIGKVPMTQHVFIATGMSGTGLTYGTAAGRMIADMILNPSAVDNVLSPTRFKPLTAAKSFLSENLNAAKHFVSDRRSKKHSDSLESVNAGEGAIVEVDGDAYAIYRDPGGQLHSHSPVCTHAGCYVQWNNFEKTWDCPCHGGRFSAMGKRISGPPPADLDRKSIPAAHAVSQYDHT